MLHTPPSLFIVFNAASGSDDVLRAADQVSQRLQAAGRPHGVHLVRRAEDLGALTVRALHEAREAGGCIVAAGGDGTLNHIAQAAWNADVPMGVLPLGTFNYFARAHGVPTDLEGAVDALLAAQVQPGTVGMLGDRLFLVNASVGLYPRLLEEREAATLRYGRHRLVALLAGLATLLTGRGTLTLELESAGHTRVVRARTLFVGNNPQQLAVLGLPVARDVEQGALAAITLHPLSRLRTAWLIARGAAGRLHGSEGVDSFSFQRLTVRTPHRRHTFKVAMDGEVLSMPAPLVFRVAPRPLRLLVPAAEMPATEAA